MPADLCTAMQIARATVRAGSASSDLWPVSSTMPRALLYPVKHQRPAARRGKAIKLAPLQLPVRA